MKVLVIRNAFEYDFGGAEKLAVYLASSIQQDGESLLLSCQPRTLALAQSEGVAQRRCPWWKQQNWSGGRILLVPIYLLWLVLLSMWYVAFLSTHKFDAIHILSKDDFFAATIAGKLFRKRIVWTDCADLKFLYQNYHVWYKNPVGKLLFFMSHLADTVTMVSKNEQRLIETSLGRSVPNNYRVIYTAARQQNVTPLERQAEDKDAVVFCATSRLVVAKGIGELIQAFNKLSAQSDRYRLWLVGDGPDEQQFRELGKDNPHITFVGHSNAPLTYVAAADVFVHPTYHEGFSLSLLEAALLGKPMIATEVGGNPELVNAGNGLLVPPKSVAPLCQAMRTLGADSHTRAKLGKQAAIDAMTFEFNNVMRRDIKPLYETRAH